MFGIESLEIRHLVTAAYIVVGLLVAYFYMKREDMLESAAAANIVTLNIGNIVFFALAAMWPILIFAMLIAPKKHAPKQRSEDEE